MEQWRSMRSRLVQLAQWWGTPNPEDVVDEFIQQKAGLDPDRDWSGGLIHRSFANYLTDHHRKRVGEQSLTVEPASCLAPPAGYWYWQHMRRLLDLLNRHAAKFVKRNDYRAFAHLDLRLAVTRKLALSLEPNDRTGPLARQTLELLPWRPGEPGWRIRAGGPDLLELWSELTPAMEESKLVTDAPLDALLETQAAKLRERTLDLIEQHLYVDDAEELTDWIARYAGGRSGA